MVGTCRHLGISRSQTDVGDFVALDAGESYAGMVAAERVRTALLQPQVP
jgi:hypothetical protein